MQKRMYKVLCPIERTGGGTYWMRVGSGFTNKDDSLNIYLDAMPVKFTHLQLRELNEEDLRRRETARQTHMDAPISGAAAAEPVPF